MAHIVTIEEHSMVRLGMQLFIKDIGNSRLS